MAKYQNLLVAIDPDQDDIKAFLTIYDFSYEMTTLLSPDERIAMRRGVIEQRTAWITEQCRHYLDSGVQIEIKVVWHNRPFEAIIQEVLAFDHDLLLKMAHQHDRFESVI